jgi:hypothetical protein
MVVTGVVTAPLALAAALTAWRSLILPGTTPVQTAPLTAAAAPAPVVLQLRWVGVFKPILHHWIHREYGLELLWSAGVFGIGIVMLLSKDDRICVLNSVVPI